MNITYPTENRFRQIHRFEQRRVHLPVAANDRRPLLGGACHHSITSSFAKLASSFLTTGPFAELNSTSTSTSSAPWLLESTRPVPKSLCRTLSPTLNDWIAGRGSCGAMSSPHSFN